VDRGRYGGKTVRDVEGDRRLKQLVERNVEIISEASRRIPDDLKSDHPPTPWADIATVGNLLRHRYHLTDIDILWQIVTSDLPTLKVVIEAMIGDLPE
jgi:uncharacterized protein with HEPN domain